MCGESENSGEWKGVTVVVDGDLESAASFSHNCCIMPQSPC